MTKNVTTQLNMVQTPVYYFSTSTRRRVPRCPNNPAPEQMFRANVGTRLPKKAGICGTKVRPQGEIRRRRCDGINLSNPPPDPHMRFNPAIKAPLYGPAVPSWAEDDSQ
jgi:hypothetical protein